MPTPNNTRHGSSSALLAIGLPVILGLLLAFGNLFISGHVSAATAIATTTLTTTSTTATSTAQTARRQTPDYAPVTSSSRSATRR